MRARRSGSGLKSVLAIFSAVALGGCAVGPDYQRPDAAVPLAWKTEAGWQASAPRDADLKGAWWEIFKDQQLDTLEQRALKDGQTLVMAQALVMQARAQANVADSAFFPKVGLQGGVSRAKTSKDRPLASYTIPNSSVIQNDYNSGFTVSYELDLFGRVRRQSESANASAEQAQANFENTRLILTAELAADYFALRESDAEIDLLQQTLAAQNKGLEYVEARHDLGAASALDLTQQQALTAATQTQLTLLVDQRTRYEHAIATLVGTPAPDFTLAADVHLASIPALPADQPASLLERRPDIAAAERAMAAANAQIGLARSAYFPSLSLNGLYGSDSNQLANVLAAPSMLWGIGASFTQTIFDGGRTKATVKFAEAGYQQAVASYRQSVLVAFQEVQDGLSSNVRLAEAAKSAATAANSAAASLSLSRDRYNGGVADHLEVIMAEQTALAYRRQLVQLDGQRLLNTVLLIKALGGGWHRPQTEKTAAADMHRAPEK